MYMEVYSDPENASGGNRRQILILGDKINVLLMNFGIFCLRNCKIIEKYNRRVTS